MSKKHDASKQAERIKQAFSQESFDKAFMSALRKVAGEPMPDTPKTIYELRPNAVGWPNKS